MQTVYIGNTLVNDVMLGANRMTDIRSTSPTIVTSSLIYYWDASVSASAVDWKNVIPYGNRTGSLTQTTYTSTYPQTFNLTGSTADINFGSVAGEIQSSPYTIIMVVSQKNDTALTNLTWFGNSPSQNLSLQTTGSIGSSKKLRVSTDNSSSIASNLNFSLNEFHQVALTVSSSTFAGINVWVDNNKESFTGGTAIGTIGGLYWIIGNENSQRPLSGSVIAYTAYNRVLTDSEILQNYDYFQVRLGNI